MLWKLRAIVYGCLAIVAALVLIGGGDEDGPVFADGRTSRFRFDDDRLVVREKVTRRYDGGYAGERNYTLEARIADGRVTGTVRGIENVTGPGRRYVCESPEVTFSAG